MDSLKVQDLFFRYDPAHPFIFQGVSVEIPFGYNVLFVGDNGSGKSTLGRLICGLLKPTNGVVMVSNDELWRLDPKARVKQAFYIVQDNHLQLFKSSLREEILFTRKLVNSTRDYESVYPQFALPQDFSIHPLDLSVNEMWRLALLLGWIITPTLLFIDEIPAWSNKNNRHALETLLRERRDTGLITCFSFQREPDLQFDQTLRINKGGIENV